MVDGLMTGENIRNVYLARRKLADVLPTVYQPNGLAFDIAGSTLNRSYPR